MGRIWRILGKIAYHLTWPLLMLYLHKSRRTRLLLIADGKLLVLKGWLGNDNWQLPGGGLHKSEQPVAGLLRELREETGIQLDAAAIKPVSEWRGYFGRFYTNYYGFVAELRLAPPVKKTGLEISETRWQPLELIGTIKMGSDARELLSRWQGQSQSDKL